MTNYIDGFAFPVHRDRLKLYKEIVEQVAEIWKEHGALKYSEYIADDLNLEGTRSFTDAINAKKDEIIIFGWVEFESRKARDLANERVAADPRMADLIKPLTHSSRPIFDAERMVYGGFRSFVQSSRKNTG